MEVYQYGLSTEEIFHLLSKYIPEENRTVRQAKFYADGEYAIVQCKYDFVVLDIANPSELKVIR